MELLISIPVTLSLPPPSPLLSLSPWLLQGATLCFPYAEAVHISVCGVRVREWGWRDHNFDLELSYRRS